MCWASESEKEEDNFNLRWITANPLELDQMVAVTTSTKRSQVLLVTNDYEMLPRSDDMRKTTTDQTDSERMHPMHLPMHPMPRRTTAFC